MQTSSTENRAFVRCTKRWIFRQGTAPSPTTEGPIEHEVMLAACLIAGVWTTSAGAMDLAELAPLRKYGQL